MKNQKNLSEKEKERIIDLTKNLKLRQEKQDNPELLPKVTKADIPKHAPTVNLYQLMIKIISIM